MAEAQPNIKSHGSKVLESNNLDKKHSSLRDRYCIKQETRFFRWPPWAFRYFIIWPQEKSLGYPSWHVTQDSIIKPRGDSLMNSRLICWATVAILHQEMLTLFSIQTLLVQLVTHVASGQRGCQKYTSRAFISAEIVSADGCEYIKVVEVPIAFS